MVINHSQDRRPQQVSRPRTVEQRYRDAEVERQRAEADEDGYGQGIALALILSLAAIYVPLIFLLRYIGWL